MSVRFLSFIPLHLAHPHAQVFESTRFLHRRFSISRILINNSLSQLCPLGFGFTGFLIGRAITERACDWRIQQYSPYFLSNKQHIIPTVTGTAYPHIGRSFARSKLTEPFPESSASFPQRRQALVPPQPCRGQRSFVRSRLLSWMHRHSTLQTASA